jgi:hypothetical protein
LVVGSGKGMFKDGLATTKLELVKTKAFVSGVLALWYQPAR